MKIEVTEKSRDYCGPRTQVGSSHQILKQISHGGEILYFYLGMENLSLMSINLFLCLFQTETDCASWTTEWESKVPWGRINNEVTPAGKASRPCKTMLVGQLKEEPEVTGRVWACQSIRLLYRALLFFLDKGLTKYSKNIYSHKRLEEMLYKWTFKWLMTHNNALH